VSDVWSVKKVNPQSMVHLTEKPVELAVRAMLYSSLAGENVLDLFGGSGSTLIAAEQTGRNAYLMELDTLYCDVIVQRWEKFTGKKAQRVPGLAAPSPLVAHEANVPGEGAGVQGVGETLVPGEHGNALSDGQGQVQTIVDRSPRVRCQRQDRPNQLQAPVGDNRDAQHLVEQAVGVAEAGRPLNCTPLGEVVQPHVVYRAPAGLGPRHHRGGAGVFVSRRRRGAAVMRAWKWVMSPSWEVSSLRLIRARYRA
jgi:hypothetical protein